MARDFFRFGHGRFHCVKKNLDKVVGCCQENVNASFSDEKT